MSLFLLKLCLCEPGCMQGKKKIIFIVFYLFARDPGERIMLSAFMLEGRAFKLCTSAFL